MWCSTCQQDVPAVARHTQSPLVCPRCQLELADRVQTQPADSGIALAAYDRKAPQDSPLPTNEMAEEDSRQRMRQIGRQLRMSYKFDQARSALPGLPVAPPALLPDIELKRVSRQASNRSASNRTSWQISLVLLLGAISFCGGVCLLAWSAAFQLVQLWQWGMAATIVAEGLLILGLTGMAVRLWRNSSRLNHQLSGVDHSIRDIQQQTGALAGSRMSASQHYYHHYNQVASPHYLMANLRGQIDQLAARMASE